MRSSDVQSRRRERRRRGSVYLIVLATAMTISVIGLTSIIAVRAQFRTGGTEESIAKARIYAQSAIDLVVFRLTVDSGWRAKHVNDEWASTEHVGELGFTYKLVDDANANLTDDPTAPVRMYTKAAVGDAIRQYSVLLDISSKGGMLRAYVGSGGISSDQILANKWWAQYFKPVLPPDATGWWITSVELMVRQGVVGRSGNIVLLEPLGNNMPSSSVIDQVSFNSNDLPPGFAWHEFKFAGNDPIDPNDGVCLALTTASGQSPMSFEYQGAGVAESDSALITGDPFWNTYSADKSLQYRVHGVYVTPPTIVPATWQREVD